MYGVLPRAPDVPSDVPFLLDESVVLDDDGVLEVHVSVGRCHVELPGSATAVDWHVEAGYGQWWRLATTFKLNGCCMVEFGIVWNRDER